MFKRIAFLLVVTALLVSGCAPAAPAATDAPAAPAATDAPAPAQEPVTITYSYWDQNFTPYITEAIAEFNKTEPNIKVETQVIPWAEYWNKLQASVAGGEVSDVLWMNVPNYKKYAGNDTLMKLDDLIAQDNVDMGMFPVNSYVGLEDGQYTMPNNFDVMGLWYNKKIFDEANMEYPNPDWTWDDLYKASKTLTKDGVYGFVAPADGYAGWWNFVAQSGSHLTNEDGSKVTFDDAAGCEGINFYTNFIREGISPDGPTLVNGDPASIFTSGNAAMMIFGSWMVPPLSENPDFQVTSLPKGNVDTSYTHNMSNAMWSKTTHPEAAWKFLKFLSSNEGIAILAKNGGNIPDYKGVEEVWISAHPNLNLTEVYSQVGKQTSWPPGTMEYLDAINKVWSDTYNGNLPWEDLCVNSAKAGNDVLAAP